MPLAYRHGENAISDHDGETSMKAGTSASERRRKGIGWLKPAARKLGLVSAGVAMALVVAEIGLMICGVSYPRIWQADHYRGGGYRPGAEFDQSKEGKAHIRINRDGFRDKDRPAEKPPQTVRIAVLGDSYVEAAQVPVERRFTELLEIELKSRNAFDGANVEVMNFGVSGYGTAQELQTLRHCVWRYHPDIVLLAFLAGNDIRNNYEPLQGEDERPYFVLRDGELLLDTSFRTSPGYIKTWREKLGLQIIDRSRLAQLAYHVRSRLQEHRHATERQQRAGKYSDAEKTIELGLDALVFRPPQGADWQAAWRVTEEIIKKMHGEVRQQEARFLVVTLTTGIQVHPNSDTRRDFSRRLEVHDLFYPDERVESWGQKEGFPVVNLCYPFLEHAETHNVFLHGFENSKKGKGHWNAEGHRLAAEVLAPKIVELFGSSSDSDH